MRALFGHKRKDLGISSQSVIESQFTPAPANYRIHGQSPVTTRGREPPDQADQNASVAAGAEEADVPESRIWPSPRPLQNRAGVGSGARVGGGGGGRAVVPPTPSAGLFLATPRIAPGYDETREPRPLATMGHHAQPATMLSPYTPLPSHSPHSTHLAPPVRSPRSPRSAKSPIIPNHPHTGPRQPPSPPRDRIHRLDRLSNSGQVAARIKRYSVNLVDAPVPHRAVWNYGLGRDHYLASTVNEGRDSVEQPSGRGGQQVKGQGIQGGRGVVVVRGGGGHVQGEASQGQGCGGGQNGVRLAGDADDARGGIVGGGGAMQRGPSRRGVGGVVPMMPKLLSPLAQGQNTNARLSPQGGTSSAVWRPSDASAPAPETSIGTSFPTVVRQMPPLSTNGPSTHDPRWAQQMPLHHTMQTSQLAHPPNVPFIEPERRALSNLHLPHSQHPSLPSRTDPFATRLTSFIQVDQSRVTHSYSTAVDAHRLAHRPESTYSQPSTVHSNADRTGIAYAYVQTAAQEYRADNPGQVNDSAWQGQRDGYGGADGHGAARPLPVPLPLARPTPAPLCSRQLAHSAVDGADDYSAAQVNSRSDAHGGQARREPDDSDADARGGAGQALATVLIPQPASYARPLPLPNPHPHAHLYHLQSVPLSSHIALSDTTNQGHIHPPLPTSAPSHDHTNTAAHLNPAPLPDVTSVPPNYTAISTSPAPAPAPAPMDRSTSRPGGPRPLGLSRGNTKLPVATTYRGIPVRRLSPARSRPFSPSADASQDHAPVLASRCDTQLSSESAIMQQEGGGGGALTLSRRAAISRHSNQSYLSSASAYTARTYSSSCNAQHRLSLVSALSGIEDELIEGSTAGTAGHGDEHDVERGQPGMATYIHNGQLTDSPPQQSDSGRAARVEVYERGTAQYVGSPFAAPTPRRRTGAPSSLCTPTHHTPLPISPTDYPQQTYPNPLPPLPHMTPSSAQKRSNSTASSVTLEWQPDTLQHSHILNTNTAVRNAWEDMERKLGRRVNSALDAERGEWVVRRVQRDHAHADAYPGSGHGHAGEVEFQGDGVGPGTYMGEQGELQVFPGDAVVGQGERVEDVQTRSPGEFSISDYLHFDAQTPYVPPASENVSGVPSVVAMPASRPTLYTPHAATPLGQPIPSLRAVSPRNAHMTATTAVPAQRPFLHIDTRISQSSTSTPPTSVQSGTETLQTLDRPVLPPLQTTAARRSVFAARSVIADNTLTSNATGRYTTDSSTGTKLQRTKTARSRHLALGTSSVRVKYGHAGRPVDHERVIDTQHAFLDDGRAQSGKRQTTLLAANEMTRASTIDSAVYAPSALTSAYPSDNGGDLSEYYHMDDSLFPVSLSPIAIDDAKCARQAGAAGVESGGAKRRRTGDGHDSALGAADSSRQGNERTLRIWRDKTQRYHHPSFKGKGGISSADYADATSAPLASENASDGLADGHADASRGKRTRDGLTRLDTQIVHVMRAFKSRAVSPFAAGSGVSATSPDVRDVLGGALDSAASDSAAGKDGDIGGNGRRNRSEDGESQTSGRRRGTIARWGQQALSRVVSRSRSKRGSRLERGKGEENKSEREEREVVLLDTPRLPHLDTVSHPDGRGGNSDPMNASLRPASPASPILITPPTHTRALPISPPQQGLGLGVPIGLRSTYSLYNRPADLTLPDDSIGGGVGDMGNQTVTRRNKPLPIPAALIPAPHVSPYTPNCYYHTRQLPLPPAPAETSPCPRSPIWPDAERDAAQMLRVKDLDTGHACEVAMSRVEQALAAISR